MSFESLPERHRHDGRGQPPSPADELRRRTPEQVTQRLEDAVLKLTVERAEALRLLRLALHLRMYGENAPGGSETWAEFDRGCEAFLRAAEPPA